MQQEVGYAISSKGYLVYLDGLPTVKVNELVESDNGSKGVVNALMSNRVEVLMLDNGIVFPGQTFRKSNNSLTLNVGNFLLGRAINPLGFPIDGKGWPARMEEDNHILDMHQDAKGIQSREFIKDQFITGVTLVDTLVPIGKGQRELLLGDPYSGKTDFLIDLIVNQRQTGVVCIYASIGKPVTQVRSLIDVLSANQALAHTVIIATSSSEPAPLIFFTPHAALTVAEYFQKQGKDVLLILDDLGIHAKIYREISLLSDKTPGRESYPGDMFHQHSHLLERAGKFNNNFGGGSITAIPVIEINLNDFTTLIPTNVMSMTDGHLMFKSSLHNQGQTPAIDISLSVSRVGRQTQIRVINLLSQRIRQLLAHADSLETVSRFSSELPYETQLVLRQKQLIEEMIRQESLTMLPQEIQAILLGLVFTSFLKEQTVDFVKANKQLLINSFLKEDNLLQVTNSVANFKTDIDLIKTLETFTPVLQALCK